jgi:hypothetical protein
MYFTRSVFTFRAESNNNISKISRAGMTMSGKASIGEP